MTSEILNKFVYSNSNFADQTFDLINPQKSKSRIGRKPGAPISKIGQNFKNVKSKGQEL